MFENYPDLCTVTEMCEMLRCGKTHARELIKNCSVPSRKIHGRVLIPKNAIIRYYLRQDKRGKFPAPPDPFTFYRMIDYLRGVG